MISSRFVEDGSGPTTTIKCRECGQFMLIMGLHDEEDEHCCNCGSDRVTIIVDWG